MRFALCPDTPLRQRPDHDTPYDAACRGRGDTEVRAALETSGWITSSSAAGRRHWKRAGVDGCACLVHRQVAVVQERDETQHGDEEQRRAHIDAVSPEQGT